MKLFKRTLAGVLTLLVLITSINIQSYKAHVELIPTPAANREKTQIIVKYKDTSAKETTKAALKEELKLNKLESKGKLAGSQKLELLEIDSNDNISKVIKELEKNKNIEYAHPNYLLESTSINDPRFNEQWGLLNNGQFVGYQSGTEGIDISATHAWSISTGFGVLVGVLDSGIDINHSDLYPNIFANSAEIPGNGLDDDGNGYIDDINGWNFVDNTNQVYSSSNLHGTQMAGIIAASANSEGIRGVAPDATIVPLKFMVNGRGYTSDAIAAIEYAKTMGIKIINCSFGSDQYNPALREAMVNAPDILFVAAAGNNGSDTASHPIYPAAYNLPNVISVAALDNTGQLAYFSNYGTNVHVAAPGVNILSTSPDGKYDYLSGTSASAAYVTGIAALIKAEYPDMNAAELAARIKGNVMPLPELAGQVASEGLANAYKALTGFSTPIIITIEDPIDLNLGEQTQGMLGALSVDIAPALLEMIHYGEDGVNPATGNYSRRFIDLSVPAPGFTVNISRTYNSKDNRATSFMGKGWTFGFEGSLKLDTSDPNIMIARLPSGAAQVFIKSGSTYTAYDSRCTLVKQADNSHILTTKDQYTYGFSPQGWLVWMKDRNGNAITIDIDDIATGKIGKITDTVGREYILAYNTSDYISTITAPDDTVIEYIYTNGLLTSVKDPSGNVTSYEYNGAGLLSQVRDRKGDLVESVTYKDSETIGVYAIGGVGGLQNVDKYDPLTNSWTAMSYMRTARYGLAASSANGKTYAIGGYIDNGDYGTLLSTVEEYNSLTNVWTYRANMPTARRGLGSATVVGRIYAIGGYSDSGTSKKTEEYNPITNTWSTKADMLTAREGLGVVACNGKIYAIGGTQFGTYLNVVEEYDPVTNNWVEKASMPTARYGLGVAVINGKMYAIGGYSSNGNSSAVEEYDPVTNTWTIKASMPTPRRHLALATFNNKIYAIGGYPNGGNISVLEEYNPLTNTWVSRANMITGRYILAATSGPIEQIVSTTADRYGNVRTFDYDKVTRKATITDSLGLVITKWYDASLYVIKSTDPEGKSTTVEYYLESGVNKYGEERSITDRHSNTVTYLRDARGNITKVINPDLSTREYIYDDKNNLIMEKDEEGKSIYYVYDADGINLLKEVKPLNGTDSYDAGVDDSKYAITTYSYYTLAQAQQMGCPSEGLLKSVTDPEGNIMGEMSKVAMPVGLLVIPELSAIVLMLPMQGVADPLM